MNILLVEDDYLIRDAIVSDLESHGDVVHAEESGDTGLIRAKYEAYDLAILDINLPKVSGWEIARQLIENKPTPVIFTTARNNDKDIVRGLELGANDYLVKPFSMSVLRARIRNILRLNGKKSVGSKLTLCHNVEFNFVSKVVTKNGAVVELSARELSMLDVLVHYRGKVLSKSNLVDRLVNNEVDIENPENFVDVILFRLRRKLGPKIIITRRNIGYQIGECDE